MYKIFIVLISTTSTNMGKLDAQFSKDEGIELN